MRDLLNDVIAGCDGFVELRYHSRVSRAVLVQEGRLEGSSVSREGGVGVRVLDGGTWGFSSTSDLSAAAVRRAVDNARAAARASAALRREKIGALPSVALAVGDFEEPGVDEVLSRPLEAKLQLAADMEARARAASERIAHASCRYSEIYEEKAIVTTDGADASVKLIRPEFRISAVAERDGQRMSAAESAGVTGGWDCLFRRGAEAMVDRAAATAVDLLSAGKPEGGRATVILSPAVVGLLVHEAVGHTVEADFVRSGSVAAGLMGQRVASELVTLCDSGLSEYFPGAGGTLPVDDEGVLTGRTTIIDRGILTSYLHNRETAAHFGVAPTGNARAWRYDDEPLVRMRNTYIAPGDQSLEEMIASTDDGWLLDGPSNGQADATGEFMFGVTTARRIRNGKLAELVRGVTVTGLAFEVLKTVDAVSREFHWDLGSGYCGKGQRAKVDAGGPYLRCQVILGGEQ
jgi:TldD protein